MNKVILKGRTVKDIELIEYGEKGGVFARFAIAVRDGKDSNGEERAQFINCLAWNTTAELLAEFVKKGDEVLVAGRLVQNDYEDKDGVKHYSFNVVVNEVEFIGAGKEKPKEEKASNRKYSRR